MLQAPSSSYAEGLVTPEAMVSLNWGVPSPSSYAVVSVSIGSDPGSKIRRFYDPKSIGVTKNRHLEVGDQPDSIDSVMGSREGQLRTKWAIVTISWRLIWSASKTWPSWPCPSSPSYTLSFMSLDHQIHMINSIIHPHHSLRLFSTWD